jgi:hypothetical protein
MQETRQIEVSGELGRAVSLAPTFLPAHPATVLCH